MSGTPVRSQTMGGQTARPCAHGAVLTEHTSRMIAVPFENIHSKWEEKKKKEPLADPQVDTPRSVLLFPELQD